jgi:hypothetical protein
MGLAVRDPAMSTREGKRAGVSSPKPRNPQDATRRNVQASAKRDSVLAAKVLELDETVGLLRRDKELQRRLGQLEGAR